LREEAVNDGFGSEGSYRVKSLQKAFSDSASFRFTTDRAVSHHGFHEEYLPRILKIERAHRWCAFLCRRAASQQPVVSGPEPLPE
jgi:hypothetical protein